MIDNIYTSEEIEKLFGVENLDFTLLKKGCEMCDIAYKLMMSRFFVKNLQFDLSEEERLAKEEADKLHGGYGKIILISKVETKHPRYSYYKMLSINSNNVMDIKKIIKIHKLKAFL